MRFDLQDDPDDDPEEDDEFGDDAEDGDDSDDEGEEDDSDVETWQVARGRSRVNRAIPLKVGLCLTSRLDLLD